MIAYSGRYRVEGSTITTKVEAAWNESWVGGEQVRHIRFEGDRLFIESPPMPHPNIVRQDRARDRGLAAGSLKPAASRAREARESIQTQPIAA